MEKLFFTTAYAYGFYSLGLYLPFSNFAHQFRRISRRFRGKLCPPTALPKVAWQTVFPRRPIRLVETRKANGNVSLSELGLLAQAAANVRAGDPIIEIGTFDGRSTLNMVINCAPGCAVLTIDLPPNASTVYSLHQKEKRFLSKPYSGARFLNPPGSQEPAAGKIKQLLGDSAAFDWSTHLGLAGLVFVDGSHAYKNVLKDSETALKLIHQDGFVLWHDYGVWPDVTRALEELNLREKRNLVHIRGTSLVLARS